MWTRLFSLHTDSRLISHTPTTMSDATAPNINMHLGVDMLHRVWNRCDQALNKLTVHMEREFLQG